MNLSSLATKGTLIKGSLALSGISGASVGSWYFSNVSFYKGNYIISPPNIDLKIPSSGTHYIQTNSCFKKFFGNVNTSFSVSNFGAEIQNPSSSESDSDPEGCVTMRMSENSSNNSEYAFESESSVKNKNIGVFFKLEVSTSKTDQVRYTVFFLEKKNYYWKIKWGFIAKTLSGSSIQLKSPDTSNKIDKTFNFSGPHSSSFEKVKWNHKYYSGIWKKESNGPASLLEYKLEPACGLISAIFDYKISNFSYSSSNFDNWYKPFENQKGKWTEIPEFG